jgi:hypothetical protein
MIFLLVLLAAEPSFDRLLEEAVALKAKGELEGTLAKLSEAERMRPHFKIRHNMGAVLEELGRYREAVDAYRKVTADPAAPLEVVQEDAQRIVRLEPKVSFAWVLVRGAGVEAYLDNEPLVLGEERGVPAGSHVLETRWGSIVELSIVVPQVGRRTVIEAGRASQSDRAVLRLDADPEWSGLELDGYVPRGVLSRAKELWVAPGKHTVAVDRGAYGRAAADWEGGAGSTVGLSELILSTAVPVARVEEVSSLAPWIAGGGGAVLAIAGAVLLVTAAAERGEVSGASREGDVITGVTMREAEEIYAGARTKTAAGGIAVGGGVALLAGALMLSW